MRSIFGIALLVFIAGCDSSTATAEAGGETLVGKYVENGKVAAFLGVPFAEPPVGELRWAAPQPLTTKLERREVVEFAPACMQSMRILDWYRYMAELFGASGDYYDDLEVSEDCLYLNVWTPTLKTDAKLPVMVWIHGGSNRSGWSYEPNYHGNILAQRNVVVVSVAYRQGLFGFISHDEMNGNDAVANFGMWDLIASLQWIRDNIDRFGGDPGRVTLFGESAGAQNAVALMFAKRAQGLFHRVIGQSTAGFGLNAMSTLEAEQKRLRELGSIVGVEPNTLKALREIPANVLLSNYEEAFASTYHSPAIDGQLFTQDTWDNIEAGEFPDIPVILGTNDHEWLDSLADDTTWEDVVERSETLLHMESREALAVVESEQDPQRALDRLITANRFLCKAQHAAAKMTAAGGDAWMFHFTRVREDPAGAELGAFHGAEYAYVFGVHDDYMTTTDIDRQLQEAMQTYWVRFAATGDPNSDDTPTWPQFTAPDLPVQELGNVILTKPAPEPELCALFEDWLAESAAQE